MQVFRTALGDLVPGAFPIPSNPILLGVAQHTGITGLADLVAAAFPLPQNPIMAATSMDRPKILTPADTKNALLRSLTAQRTGPTSTSVGMGDATSVLQSTGQFLDNSITVQGYTIPYWALAIAGVAIVGYLTTGKAGPNRAQRFRSAHSA